ncbi:MAG TPA: ATP-binding protein [Chitinophagales bacterium]|nr:ATP-binding protein [Chitinophagales bacterium]
MKANHQSIEVVQSDAELASATVRCCGDAIFTATTKGIINSWNPGAEKLLGYMSEEIKGNHLSVLIPLDKAEAAAGVVSDLLNATYVDHFITNLIRKDKKELKVSVSLSAIKDDGGLVTGIVCIVRNTFSTCREMPTGMEEVNEMLEQKVAERTFELQEANKALEAFSYSVSHDLKAPVRAIHSFTRIIQKDFKQQLPAEVLDLLTHIEGNSRRMNCIIEDLLTLSKYSRFQPDLAPIDMALLFNTVWDNLQRSTPNNATLTLHALPVVCGDASMIEQVVVNLLSNAIKYSAHQGKPIVEVGTELVNGQTNFYVRDNGAGFDMQYYHRLFGVFERLHSMNDFEGTGIGLFLVKRIIEKHGGMVWAHAKVDEGATFYFTLPQNK